MGPTRRVLDLLQAPLARGWCRLREAAVGGLPPARALALWVPLLLVFLVPGSFVLLPAVVWLWRRWRSPGPPAPPSPLPPAP